MSSGSGRKTQLLKTVRQVRMTVAIYQVLEYKRSADVAQPTVRIREVSEASHEKFHTVNAFVAGLKKRGLISFSPKYPEGQYPEFAFTLKGEEMTMKELRELYSYIKTLFPS